MQISPELAQVFNLDPKLECYDNSTLATVDSCIRKAYWKLLFPLEGIQQSPAEGAAQTSGVEEKHFLGIQEKVGLAAHFGTSIHSAMDKMYSPILFHSKTYEARKIAAFRAFSAKYAEVIPDHDLVESPYSHPDGIALLDYYFNHYQDEDGFFIPIDTELCAVILLKDLDPPCYWISRLDGVVFRPSQSDYLVREFKTTKSSIQNKLDELRISRQVEGYVWSLRQFPSKYPISGVMPDILAVRTKERDPRKLFCRDIFHITPLQAEQWYQETLVKIVRWREVRAKALVANNAPLLQHFQFDRSTNECLRYGKCSYYDLCVYGLNNVDLQKFLPNDWNPLHSEKMKLE